MGDIADDHRERYYSYEWFENDEGDNQHRLNDLIKKYSDNQKYSVVTLVEAVKARIKTGRITHPTPLGIIATFEQTKVLSGKQRDVLIKALAYTYFD